MRKLVPFALAALFAAACSETPGPAGLATDPLAPITTVAAAITVVPSVTGATVDTDKEDYAPGETVTITGAGWAAGETVHLNLAEDPVADGPHDWDVVADANGSFTDTSFGPGTQHLGVTFTLTATGPVSGTSMAIFTDGDITNGTVGVHAGTASGSPASGCTGSTTTSVQTGTEVCALAAFTISNSGGTAVQIRWKSPANVIVAIDQRSTNFANGDVGAKTFSASRTPLDVGTWTVLVCEGANSGLAPSGTPGCQTGMERASATFEVTAPPSDNTPPIIGYVLNPASPDGDNGWYKSNVTLTWIVTEFESPGSLSKTGCVDQNITADQANTTYSCSATSTGGSAGPVNVEIKRDATPPSISGAASPLANGNGWNNTDVTVAYTCSDALSGVASCGPDETLTSEGAGQSSTGNAKDNAGNTAMTTVSNINIDKTKPVITGSSLPAANAFGWNNVDVTVSFLCTDGSGSGVDANTVAGETVSAEGANQSVTNTGSCMDKAGNTADAATVNGISIDKTPPSLTGAATTAPNAAGWYKTDVAVQWTCSDALSGLDGSCPGNSTISTEGTNQSATQSVSDKAGNTTMTTVDGIDIDKTKPVVTVTGVSDGATYVLGTVPAAGCSTTDALSGVATDASLGSSGGPVGSITATCSGAADNAGNTAYASASYNVVYDWTGFFRPIDNTILNVAKAGSAIPAKFSLGGFQGMSIFMTGYPKSQVIACDMSSGAGDVDETVTAGGSSLNYDATEDQYIYVWKTDKSWAGTCRQFQVKLIDGTMHTANFKFNK